MSCDRIGYVYLEERRLRKRENMLVGGKVKLYLLHFGVNLCCDYTARDADERLIYDQQ